jgi:hypothetical protein
MSIFEEGKFKAIGKEVEPDERKRLALAAALPNSIDGIRYRVFRNSEGQILLDPVKSVPLYEAWIYENPERVQSILRGIAQAESDDVVTIKLPRDSED